MIKDIATIFVSPLNQSLLLLAIGICLHLYRPLKKKRYRSCYIIAGAWLYLCSQYFFSYWLIAPLERYAPPSAWSAEQQHSDSAIFVFACYFYNVPELPQVSQWNDCSLRRLVHAFMMYRAYPQPIVLTGGNFSEHVNADNAEAARAFLIQLGVNDSDLITINTGTNSSEEVNALRQQNLPFKHYHIVSSASHMYRVDRLFEHYQFSSYTLHPVDHYNIHDFDFNPSMPGIQSLERSHSAMYEYAAIVKMWFETRRQAE
jgi:uncharacterized SAM-binding protein YcdF (DUF218 family)